MKVLLNRKVSKYINSLSDDRMPIFLERLSVLKDSSEKKIKKLNEVIRLSKDKPIEILGYHIIDSTYAIFAFAKGCIIVVDLAEIKDDEINSIVLYPEQTNAPEDSLCKHGQ